MNNKIKEGVGISKLKKTGLGWYLRNKIKP